MSAVVDTAEGRVTGTWKDGIARFRGVPYAHARRFAHPTAVAPWTGELDASRYGPQAPQLPTILDRMSGGLDLERSEDCLNLNVTTPGLDGARRPVLVWVHGGAFTNGTGASPWYDGSSFGARHDCVVVTINYRLGVLGYAHLDDVFGERFAGSGNLGLLDQIEALRWVQRNIAAFGGDPDNVTVFGESAGGSAVLSLLAAPAATGLFHRAVAQSASFSQLRTRERADQAARSMLAELGLGAGDADRLLDLPVDALLGAQAALFAADPLGAFTAFAPTNDGVVLHTEVDEGAATSLVPLLIGCTRDEMHLFTFLDPTFASLDDAGLVERVRLLLGDDAVAMVNAYRAARPGLTAGQLASAVAGDHAFRVPAVRLADTREAAGHRTWRYLFRWASTAFGGALGSCHALEIPFVFHTLDKAGVAFFTGDGADRGPLADAMHATWADYARHGDPGWLHQGNRPTMVFDTPTALEHDPDGDLLALWP
jgi:para-nitrobenzyl esterase